MTTQVRITRRDNGGLAFKRALQQLNISKVTVGIHEDAGMHEGGMTMAELGSIHEFGLGNVPERSFLRSWGTERGEVMVAEKANVIERELLKGQGLQTLNKLGLVAVGEIQQRMARGTPPPLQEATIQRKGSSVPLIDTGALRQSITYKVVAK